MKTNRQFVLFFESRIDKLEKQTDKETDRRETLIIYPGGEIRHYSGDGPVEHKETIKVISKKAAEGVLRVLKGERT